MAWVVWQKQIHTRTYPRQDRDSLTRLRWELQYHKRVVRMGQLHTRTYLRWGKYKELEMQVCYEVFRKMMELEFVREEGDSVARKIWE